MALPLVRPDHRPDLGIYLCCEVFARDFLAEVQQLALRQALEVPHGGSDCILEAAGVQQVARRQLA